MKVSLTIMVNLLWIRKQKQSKDRIEWILFEKCIRGDTSDNIFSASGARKKGTKNKVGMMEFADKDAKGFNWNNHVAKMG